MPESIAKPKSLSRIEEKLGELDEGSFRYQVLDTCRRFKTTWIELGQSLFSAHRDKLYREWGFLSFETYCSKELGIKQQTAIKLLRSYHFLESEEPGVLEKAKSLSQGTEKYPDLESVNLLRLAKKNKNLDETGYQNIRQKVLDDAREPQDVRKELRLLSDRGEVRSPQAVRSEQRFKFLKRLVRFLEQTKLESMANRFLPPRIIDELDDISQKVERELNRD